MTTSVAQHVRDAAAIALRAVYQGVEKTPSVGVAWEDLTEERRELWRRRADAIVHAILAAMDAPPPTVVEPVVGERR